jgi:hypothetical protein
MRCWSGSAMLNCTLKHLQNCTTVPCHATLCCAVLSCAPLCCALLRGTVLCSTLLCSLSAVLAVLRVQSVLYCTCDGHISRAYVRHAGSIVGRYSGSGFSALPGINLGRSHERKLRTSTASAGHCESTYF